MRLVSKTFDKGVYCALKMCKSDQIEQKEIYSDII